MTIKNTIARNIELLLIPLFALTMQSCNHKMKWISTNDSDDRRYYIVEINNHMIEATEARRWIPIKERGENDTLILAYIDSTGTGNLDAVVTRVYDNQNIYIGKTQYLEPDSANKVEYAKIYPKIKPYLNKKHD